MGVILGGGGEMHFYQTFNNVSFGQQKIKYMCLYQIDLPKCIKIDIETVSFKKNLIISYFQKLIDAIFLDQRFV